MVGDYGVDARVVVRTMGQLGAAALLVTIITGIIDVLWLMIASFAVTLTMALLVFVLVRRSRVGKLRERVALVDRLALRGYERVLDVGWDRGLRLIEVAHRMGAGGHAVGVDPWPRHAGADDDPGIVFENAALEGVGNRIDVTAASAGALPFASTTFDAVISRMTGPDLDDHDARVHAVREIDRVLVSGGRVVLLGFRRSHELLYALRSCNWTNVTRSPRVWRTVPPMRYVTGTKPDPSRRATVVAEMPPPPLAVEPQGDEGEISAAAAP